MGYPIPNFEFAHLLLALHIAGCRCQHSQTTGISSWDSRLPTFSGQTCRTSATGKVPFLVPLTLAGFLQKALPKCAKDISSLRLYHLGIWCKCMQCWDLIWYSLDVLRDKSSSVAQAGLTVLASSSPSAAASCTWLLLWSCLNIILEPWERASDDIAGSLRSVFCN